ncbi:MAG TPA: hypothetical protein VGL21_12625 [Jatrophihabitantaceae bacterium]|jgi:hypothetical protein
MTGFDVTPESLTGAGTHLTELGQQMMTGLQGLLDTVTGSGNPWGGDEQGTLFAGIYGLVLGKAIEAIGSHVQQVGQAGAGLTQQAELMSKTEQGNTKLNNSLRDSIAT